jgi:glycosyltransferase involved in cell wall biosynthesis
MLFDQSRPRVTVALPSLNQGRFLETALRSIFSQPIPMEVMVADGGSTDETLDVIERWKHRLTWFRSRPDNGQAAAVNEAIARGRAPLLCWLNSDDLFLPGGLCALVAAIEASPSIAVAHGDCLRLDEQGHVVGKYRTGPVTARGLSRRCIIPQPASIIRRTAWESVGGLNEDLPFSLDYDLWWRLLHAGAQFEYFNVKLAAARAHPAAKTVRQSREFYAECMSVVRRHHGSLPFVWRLAQPIRVRMLERVSALQRIALELDRWLGESNPPQTEALTDAGDLNSAKLTVLDGNYSI